MRFGLLGNLGIDVSQYLVHRNDYSSRGPGWMTTAMQVGTRMRVVVERC